MRLHSTSVGKDVGKIKRKTVKRLNAGIIRSLTKPGRYGDGEGLYLVVSRNGTKSWVQRFQINGKRHDIGLGSCRVNSEREGIGLGLREVRKLALENLTMIHEGRNPLAEKRQAADDARQFGPPTFEEAARQTLDSLRPLWRSPKTGRQWWQSMQRHVLPAIGGEPVDAIEVADLLRILAPIWNAKRETAGQLRANMGKVFEWSIAHGYRTASNPAGLGLDGALPKRRRRREHRTALHYREVPAALDAVADGPGSEAVKLALRFVALTAVRTAEARKAAWPEIDLDARVWRIPANRMKAEREHRVPLSDAAVEILERAKVLGGAPGFVFPSPHGARRGGALSEHAMLKRLKDLEIGATVHGFRSSFRDWCAETGKPREVAEAALAHVVGGTEGAYFRSDLFERRRALMQQWADYLAGEGEAANVVSFDRA